MLTRPINVLHIVETLGTGGMENGVVNLVNGLDPEIVSAEVLCTRGLGDFAKRIPSTKLHFDRSVGSGIVSAIRAVSRTCLNERFDIVHSHSWATLMPGFFGSKLSRTPKFVHGEHGTLYLDRLRRQIIQRTIFNRADCCLSVSASLKSEITSKLRLPESKFSVILNGVDLSKFRPDPRQKQRLLKAIQADADSTIIGSVGRLVPVKDYPTLLRAFAMLSGSAEKNCHLVLVGDGPERVKLQKLAEDLKISGITHFLGVSDAIENVMPAFDIFVLPSIHEGMSNTLLEAAACGVVTVASDILPNREIVAADHTGMFFDVGNPKSLCTKLRLLVSDRHRREGMSGNSLAFAKDKLSIRKMIRNYEQFYCALFDTPAVKYS